MKRQRSLASEREGVHANQEMGTHTNFERHNFVEIRADQEDGDLGDILNDLSLISHLDLTAKAA